MNRGRKGLTLIEVLIIVVMIGILLTITWTKITGTPEKQARTRLNNDIRAVREAESSYFAQHNAYASHVQLDSLHALALDADNKLTITATATGYTAVIRNESVPAKPLYCSVDMSGGESKAKSVESICN